MMRSRCESIPKQPEVELTFARDGEVAEDFADGAGEFEAVAGARAGDDHLRMRGMAIDPEVFVRRVGVEADGGGAESAVGLREVRRNRPRMDSTSSGVTSRETKSGETFEPSWCQAIFMPSPRLGKP